MKKCYDRENASSCINECLNLYYEHEDLLTAFQGELYKFMTLHLYGSVIIHSHYVQKLCDFNTSAEHKR